METLKEIREVTIDHLHAFSMDDEGVVECKISDIYMYVGDVSTI